MARQRMPSADKEEVGRVLRVREGVGFRQLPGIKGDAQAHAGGEKVSGGEGGGRETQESCADLDLPCLRRL